jgi:hypothetical protein
VHLRTYLVLLAGAAEARAERDAARHRSSPVASGTGAASAPGMGYGVMICQPQCLPEQKAVCCFFFVVWRKLAVDHGVVP